MLPANAEHILDETLERHPALHPAREDILRAFRLLRDCYQRHHKLLICGNGGSAADADHIVGELMKRFLFKRTLPEEIRKSLRSASPEKGQYLAEKLQPALRAISLAAHVGLNTAFANDVDPRLVFAQQVLGYGDPGDVLLAISTSGNSENVANAVLTAKALGLTCIGLSGRHGGRLKEICDVCIRVEGDATSDIQELHLPVYHALCKMLEWTFFGSLPSD